MDSAAPAAASGLSSIGQVAITVTNVDRAIAFYRDVLGLRLLFQVPNMGFFDCDGLRLMLSTAEKPEQSYSSVLYFRVADIQQSFASLREKGAALEKEPHLLARMPDHDLWMAFFRDSEGNLMALMSEVKRS
jgi:catechol 2,3-dioxygenase-like lactoylglutathione lyase family enzyme